MNIFLGIALGMAAITVTTSILIARKLEIRGHKVNPLWLRLFLIQHVNRYREIMLKETGSPGYLFYVWIVSINGAWLFLILSLFLG